MAIIAPILKPKNGSKTNSSIGLKEKLKFLLHSGRKIEQRKQFARKRIQRELNNASDNPSSNCSYGVVIKEEKDIFKWEGAIIGPSGSPYEGGVFFLSIHFPPNYPYKPPKIKFLTKIFHPNISEDGNIHIDILGEEWSPALGIEKLLLSICSILAEPVQQFHRRPLWNLYKLDGRSYNLKARQCTLKYAMGLS